MIHYVYRITNKERNKHYYGVRSSKVEPKLDLGIKYFSSSTDKEFINEQKINNSIFKYKVIKIFETREEAINLEIKLHNKFNVNVNTYFYNKAKQTSTKFAFNEGLKGDKNGMFKKKSWSKGLTKNNNDSLNNLSKKVKQTKNSKEWKENVGRHSVESMVTTRKNNDSFKSAQKKIFLTKNTKLCENGLTIQQNANIKSKKLKNSKEWKETIGNNAAVKISITRKTKGLAKGCKNPKAKRINIYNENDKLVFTCFGNFKEICKENGLPTNKLTQSYRKNIKTLESIDKTNKYFNFKSWYAKEVCNEI